MALNLHHCDTSLCFSGFVFSGFVDEFEASSSVKVSIPRNSLADKARITQKYGESLIERDQNHLSDLSSSSHLLFVVQQCEARIAGRFQTQ